MLIFKDGHRRPYLNQGLRVVKCNRRCGKDLPARDELKNRQQQSGQQRRQPPGHLRVPGFQWFVRITKVPGFHLAWHVKPESRPQAG